MNVNNEIVHLLGYVTAKQWADTLHELHGFNKEIIYELMRIQERSYNKDLIVEVEHIIKEDGRKI